MNADVKLLGLADIQKQFDALLMTTNEGKSVLRATLRRTFIQTIKDARANLDAGGHNRTGTLRRSLGTIISIKPDTAYAAIGARTKGKNNGYYFHFVNSGTGVRTTKKGANRGAGSETAFFDNAVRKNISSIPVTLQQAFEDEMKKFMRKKY
jgi:hypothetical protein